MIHIHFEEQNPMLRKDKKVMEEQHIQQAPRSSPDITGAQWQGRVQDDSQHYQVATPCQNPDVWEQF